MEKVICFGAGGTAKKLYSNISQKYEVIAFADNQESKQGFLFSKKVISPGEVKKYSYDYIVITSIVGIAAIRAQLVSLGVDESKIITSYVENAYTSRIEWLRSLSELQSNIDKSIAVAEAGVFRGDFAEHINNFYPDRKLHLFDTFEGFPDSDVQEENRLSPATVGEYSFTNEEIVINRLKYPENIIIHKGYFPQTAIGISSKFCFVNLDMDLYRPTLEGLRLFAPRMVEGGVIVIHDYFNSAYEKSIKKAVKEFMNETVYTNLRLMPIGDGISIAVVGF